MIAAVLFAQGVRSEGGIDPLGTKDRITSDYTNIWFQVRVQQRIIVRIPRTSQRSVPAGRTRDGRTTERRLRVKEKKVGKCLWTSRLSGAAPGNGSKQNLVLLTKNGQFIRAYLGGGCRAADFYAGAYLERAKDGKICIDRDVIHARNGAKCEIDRFRLLSVQR